MIRLIQNLLLLATVALISGLGAEVSLRLMYPKYRHAAEASVERDAIRIIARKPHAHTLQLHPDRKKLHRVRYNNLGMAHSEDFSEQELAEKVTIGLFGDSFTENWRIAWRYPVHQVLQYLLNLDEDKYRVLNFGVDGYGTDQSYLYFRHSPASKHLDHLFYFLCNNDLRNIYENNLFKIDAQGNLLQQEPPAPSFALRILSRLHVSYLALDAWNRIRPDSKIALDENIYNRMVYRELLADTKTRAWSERARQLEESIGSDTENADLDRSLTIFNQLLADWEKKAEAQEASFAVVLLPRLEEHRFQELLSSKLEVIDLYQLFSEDNPDFEYADIAFENDDHWNEEGNKQAAIQLLRHFEQKLGLTPLPAERIEKELKRYYRRKI